MCDLTCVMLALVCAEKLNTMSVQERRSRPWQEGGGARGRKGWMEHVWVGWVGDACWALEVGGAGRRGSGSHELKHGCSERMEWGT